MHLLTYIKVELIYYGKVPNAENKNSLLELTMTHLTKITIAVASALLLGSNFAQANQSQEQATSFAESLENTEVKWHFRYRLEDVDQDNALEDATASTLLSRVTLDTQTYNDFSFKLEVDNVSAVTNRDDYNSTLNGNTDYSVVADPEATEINQAALTYSGFDNTKVIAGRQRINLGTQRFVGGVGWRQNEQTYDGVLINNKSINNTNLTYAYINNINTITDGNVDTRSHFVNYDWSLADNMSLNFYGYFLDFKEAPLSSTKTIGARYSLKPTSDLPFFLNAEFAKQSEYEDNPTNLDADYQLLEVGYQMQNINFIIAQEVLSGDDSISGQAFQTPLATKHKFQGWADQFLVTPDAGIEDTYFAVNAKFSMQSFGLVYHDFKAEATSQDYGSEIGVNYTSKIDKNLSFVAKLADYSSDGYSVDTRKVWLMLVANF